MLDCDQFLDSDVDTHKSVYFQPINKDQDIKKIPKPTSEKKSKLINKNLVEKNNDNTITKTSQRVLRLRRKTKK